MNSTCWSGAAGSVRLKDPTVVLSVTRLACTRNPLNRAEPSDSSCSDTVDPAAASTCRLKGLVEAGRGAGPWPGVREEQEERGAPPP